jgi:hypothetical protein
MPNTILKKDLAVFEINQKRMAAAARLRRITLWPLVAQDLITTCTL